MFIAIKIVSKVDLIQERYKKRDPIVFAIHFKDFLNLFCFDICW